MRSGRAILVLVAFALNACATSRVHARFDELREACAPHQTWSGSRCVAWGSGHQTLLKAQSLLNDGEPEQAVEVVQTARGQGPHAHETHVRIYEQLGTAFSFSDRDEEAIAAFTKLLTLAPNHVLSYHLSARATFKFEAARQALSKIPKTEIAVAWPEDLETTRPIPIDVEVVSDPSQILSRAVLYIHRKNQTRAVDFDLPGPGRRKQVQLPALGAASPETLHLHLVGFDNEGSEVALWASRSQPRAIRVNYTAPTPWYKNGWVLAGIGGAALVSGGTVVFLATRPAPEEVPGTGILR